MPCVIGSRTGSESASPLPPSGGASDSEDELHRDPLTKIYEDIERSSSSASIPTLNKYSENQRAKKLRKKAELEAAVGAAAPKSGQRQAPDQLDSGARGRQVA